MIQKPDAKVKAMETALNAFSGQPEVDSLYSSV